MFADTRYVIKAQAERIDVNGGRRDWDGLATAISGSVKTTVEQEGNKNETNFKFLKNKIVKLAASQEVLQQQFDLQQADISSKYNLCFNVKFRQNEGHSQIPQRSGWRICWSQWRRCKQGSLFKCHTG